MDRVEHGRRSIELIEAADVEPGDRVEYDGREWTFAEQLEWYHTSLVADDGAEECGVDIHELTAVKSGDGDDDDMPELVADGGRSVGQLTVNGEEADEDLLAARAASDDGLGGIAEGDPVHDREDYGHRDETIIVPVVYKVAHVSDDGTVKLYGIAADGEGGRERVRTGVHDAADLSRCEECNDLMTYDDARCDECKGSDDDGE